MNWDVLQAAVPAIYFFGIFWNQTMLSALGCPSRHMPPGVFWPLFVSGWGVHWIAKRMHEAAEARRGS